jgi:hypothetical protein
MLLYKHINNIYIKYYGWYMNKRVANNATRSICYTDSSKRSRVAYATLLFIPAYVYVLYRCIMWVQICKKNITFAGLMSRDTVTLPAKMTLIMNESPYRLLYTCISHISTANRVFKLPIRLLRFDAFFIVATMKNAWKRVTLIGMWKKLNKHTRLELYEAVSAAAAPTYCHNIF